MAQLAVLEYPDPRLNTPCAPVTDFGSDVAELAASLLDTLYGSTGIALSAPQVGDLRQVLVMDLSGDQSAPEVYLNPEILARKKPGLVEESCLSVPGIVGNVVRHTQLRLRARDIHGETIEKELSGMHAVALQHELDHLNGKLFIERLSWLRRLRLKLAGAA
ncbi:peptide deformylase [Pseudohaliea rubra]|uniref:Peptide deformylase n=1 Tax=Pseudohaliea rubra DSM 19751 TaxID=1265313 RepID=A0A095VNI6_9GAMM|nr:peptide deformylase [Pseudohaliea rubra]KGE03027.1 Peptide deformylase [Pseudohaliea rubra DSM 19751]